MQFTFSYVVSLIRYKILKTLDNVALILNSNFDIQNRAEMFFRWSIFRLIHCLFTIILRVSEKLR